MASKYFLYPDLQHRHFFNNREFNYIILKSFISEIQLTTPTFMLLYNRVFKNSPKRSKIRNRCINTRHGRAVIGEYHFSRMSLVNLFSRGHFPGIRKAGW
jgi:ribosomal protein S14